MVVPFLGHLASKTLKNYDNERKRSKLLEVTLDVWLQYWDLTQNLSKVLQAFENEFQLFFPFYFKDHSASKWNSYYVTHHSTSLLIGTAVISTKTKSFSSQEFHLITAEKSLYRFVTSLMFLEQNVSLTNELI